MWIDCPNCNHSFSPTNNPICPHCFTFFEECPDCKEEWQKPNSITCHICKKWKQDYFNQSHNQEFLYSPDQDYLDLHLPAEEEKPSYQMAPNLFPKSQGQKKPSYRFSFPVGETLEKHKGIHIHVEGDGKMDIWIDETTQTCSIKGTPRGIPPAEQRRILRFVEDNIVYIINEWNKRKQ